MDFTELFACPYCGETLRQPIEAKYCGQCGHKLSDEKTKFYVGTDEFQTENGSKVEVKIETKIKDLKKEDLEEILHKFAACSNQFYLSLGKKIAGKDS